ncbi:DUF308 domain-containing protein [Demequina pelophila]|uniref:DUF308 domain-containing protein n=1 Tax=Demequina pelophila TaxID=1638984 RepID=UPI000785FCBF|nr:DUF308 domain-containing protein [Demequina pelophila]
MQQFHTTPPAAESMGLEIDPAVLTARAVTAVRVAFGLMGVFALALGVALLVWPGRTLAVGAALTAVYFVIAGVVRIVMGALGSALSAGMRVLGILLGLLLVIGGVVMLRNLAASTAVLLLIATITVGLGWIIDGVMAFIESGHARSRGLAIVYGVVALVAGIVVVAWPGISASVFVWLNAVALVVLGVVGLVRAFTFGRAARVQG